MLQPAATSRGIKLRLYLMMFLQYFVQGCYLPVISVYLEESMGLSKGQIGLFGTALAIGPLFSAMVLGQLADRRFATENVLALSHLAGAVLMFLLYASIQYMGASAARGFWLVLLLGVSYAVLYAPSMMLTNALAFHHLKDSDREFPLVRLWGTIGFVLPAWIVEYFFLSGSQSELLNNARGVTLLLAAGAGALMGVYSFTLPHTPPRKGASKLALTQIVELFRNRAFLVLVCVALGVAIVHKFFFVLNSPYLKAMLYRGGEAGWEGRISSIGQVAEVGVMAILALLIARLGFKWTMALGIFAYIARSLLLAGAAAIDGQFTLSMTLVCLGQAMHGFCFACFLAAGFMFVDRTASDDIRSSIQNFFGTFVLGLGFLLGGLIAGWVGNAFEAPNQTELGMATGASGWTAIYQEAGPPEDSVRARLGIQSQAGWTVVVGQDRRQDWIGTWTTSAALGLICLLVFVWFFPAAAGPRPQPHEPPADTTTPAEANTDKPQSAA